MTTGTLLPAPVLVAVDGNGAPISGALLQFYLTGTTTPATTYSNASLATPNANPVVANGSGLFGPVYLDPGVTYRLQLKTAAGSVLADIDPVSIGAAEATLTQVNAGVATGVYVSPAKLAAWTGVATALGYTPVNKAGDTATDLAITPTAPATNSAGYLGAPINNQTASYTLALSDAGKMRADEQRQRQHHHRAAQLRRGLSGGDGHRDPQHRGRDMHDYARLRGEPGAGGLRDQQGRGDDAIRPGDPGPGGGEFVGDQRGEYLVAAGPI